MWRTVHRKFQGERSQALNFFGGVTRPLRNQLHHRRGKIGVCIDGHAAEGNCARDHYQKCEHQYDKALLQGELDDAMNHAFDLRIRAGLGAVGMGRWLPSAAGNF
jgi:hypothetical protein